MPLTDTAVRQARPRERVYRLNDGRGLVLLIQPNGSKWWRFRYRWQGIEQMLSMGTYPDTPLLEARARRDVARQQLAKGIDPGAERRRGGDPVDRSFRGVAQHWLAGLEKLMRAGKRSGKTFKKAKWALENYVYPEMGSRAINSIRPSELLPVLKKIETEGLLETARRTKQRCGQVFRHGIGLGYCERDITLDLRGLLEAPIVEHHAAITEPARVGNLLRSIEDYKGRQLTRLALKLSPLVFVRPGNLRNARWAEIDLTNGQWRISHRHMKKKVQHIIPLCRQAIDIFFELKALTGEGEFVFPGVGHTDRPMSENTINKALRTMGFSGDEMTGQGFRTLASTLLNEQGWDPDVVERQLAHNEEDEVRGAYNHAEYLRVRRKMMQVWADYLEELRAGRVRLPDEYLESVSDEPMRGRSASERRTAASGTRKKARGSGVPTST
jgi:integrase